MQSTPAEGRLERPLDVGAVDAGTVGGPERHAVADLLGRQWAVDRPAVAVGVGEETESPPRIVRHVRHVDALSPQERVHLVDVVDVELHTAKRPGYGVYVARLAEQSSTVEPRGISSTKR